MYDHVKQPLLKIGVILCDYVCLFADKIKHVPD